jgi:hypothetical protein
MGISLLVPDYGPPAVLVCLVLMSLTLLIASKAREHKQFLLRLFVAGLLVRMLVGTIIFTQQLQVFFGGDAITYDGVGYALLKYWQGNTYYLAAINTFTGEGAGGGWGMIYLVAAVYGVIGRNMLAIQFINSVIGSATALLIFLCAQQFLGNARVSRIAAIFVAFYPSLVLWSSQGLKDGPIIFLLVLSMLATLKLGEKLSVKYVVLLLCSMVTLLSLRFYVFYILMVAVGGSFVIGMRQITAQSFIRQFLILIFIGLAVIYLGILRTANVQIESYGNLKAIQRSRLDQATSAQSGYEKDVDVSTTSGAISIIPFGMVYLLFAPFPWQVANLRQSITLPEMLIWWGSFPLLVLGFWFTVKYHLRRILPILIFTTMLTLAYSLFQGNIGTAYRQRSQLLVFYFIFVAVGFVLLKEKRENEKQQALALRESEKRQAASLVARRSTTNI